MLEQHFTKDWDDVHEDFTSDLHSTLLQFGRYQRTRETGCEPIDEAYEADTGNKPGPLSAFVRAGFALVITLALFGGALTVLTAPHPTLAARTSIVLL
jgi:hypothetical protein